MKIVINYDLMEEVFKEKHGFSLIKSTKQSILICTAVYGVFSAIAAVNMDRLEFAEYLNELPLHLLMNIGFLIPFDACLDKLTKPIMELVAPPKLNSLPKKLKILNINTNYDLLMGASKYKTQYEMKSGDNIIPRLVQKKYIMIPTLDEKQKEVSVLQEHVVGSHTYTLSKGSPKKQVAFNLAFNPA